MNPSNIVLYEAEYLRLKSILAMTQRDLRADLVLLIDRSGQQIASEGPAHGIDMTALSSLAAANLAATDGLARLVGEPEFSILFHQGRRRSIQISDVAKRFSLVVVFDDSVSLGMVRLRVKRATAYLEEILRGFLRKRESAGSASKAAPGSVSPFYFTDEDIDKLFSFLKPGS
ncbi:MAG: roadblock/LC7 domain-containing protein [Acidobacteriia bacterium]|nr:roadblock/LC7 domain-containing protein [Terriglobia bacterium]